MFEILLIVIGIVVAAFLILYIIWRILIGGALQTALVEFFNIAHEKESFADPEAPIEPSQRQPISDAMKQIGEQAKYNPPMQQQSRFADVPIANMSDVSVITETVNQPLTSQQPTALPDESNSPNDLQPLVENNTFEADDPVISKEYIDPTTPSADALDAHVPEGDDFPYGVRSADNSPGRRLRDKRYRRNSS